MWRLKTKVNISLYSVALATTFLKQGLDLFLTSCFYGFLSLNKYVSMI